MTENAFDRCQPGAASPGCRGAHCAVGAAGGPASSRHEAAWRARGRAVYGVPEPVPTPMVLSMADAQRAIARRLRVAFGGLAEADRREAIAAAARGYLEAHAARGRIISARRPTAAPRLLTAGSATSVDRTPEPFALPPPPDRPAPTAARRVRAPSSAATVTFEVTVGHALAKGLAGGRVRVVRGESAIDAVARRIVRDTRCSVLWVQDDGSVSADGGRTISTYRIALRGRDRGRSGSGEGVEGVIWVKL